MEQVKNLEFTQVEDDLNTYLSITIVLRLKYEKSAIYESFVLLHLALVAMTWMQFYCPAYTYQAIPLGTIFLLLEHSE